MNIVCQLGWLYGLVQLYLELPTIPRIRSESDTKFEEDYIKIKLRSNPMPTASNMFQFKIAVFKIARWKISFFFIRLSYDA